MKHTTSILTTFLAFYILFSLRDNLGVVLSASLFALQTTILSYFYAYIGVDKWCSDCWDTVYGNNGLWE